MGLKEKCRVDKIVEIADIDEQEVIRVKEMRIKSQHKRNVPLVPKIGLRTVALDWRSPVQEGQ